MKGRRRPYTPGRLFSFLTCAGVILATVPLPAQPPSDTACVQGPVDDCRHMLTATAAFAAMLASGDPAAVAAHFAADAQVILSDGSLIDRSGLIAAVRAAPRAERARLDRAAIRITDDVAVVTWAESWSGGQRPAGRTVGTDVWHRRADRWQVVSSVEVRPTP